MGNQNSVNKPVSLPDHWPHPTQEDLDAKPQRFVNVGTEQDFWFTDNSIKTSKYELYSFLPKFLIEQFNPKAKIANCYFLLIACMQVIPAITNTSGYPTVLIPLITVLFIFGVFIAVEDYSRHVADKAANSSKTQVLDKQTGAFKTVLWSEVVVGDLVKVMNREVIPADLVIMEVAEPNPESPKGLCYIETKSLDGETNLKLRNTLPFLIGQIKDVGFYQTMRGKIEMEHPNKFIDSFTGVIELEGREKNVILPNNVILRGCVLRSTDYMVGLAVNTGHDVKIMQSNLEASIYKSTNLEHEATKQILGVILMLLSVCFVGATAQAIFNNVQDIDSFSYLDSDYLDNPVGNWFIQFFYLLLLHASFVPVSLYVTMAIVRFIQSYFMNVDLEMYYPLLDARALVRTQTINEELGQISHIFSDKTGTLTCNVMNFRKMSINGIIYGQGITEIGKAAWKLLGKPVPEDVLHAERQAAAASVAHVSFWDPNHEFDISAYDEEEQTARNLDAKAALEGMAKLEKEASTVRNAIASHREDLFKENSGVAIEDLEVSSKDFSRASSKSLPMEYRTLQKRKIQEYCRMLAICHEVVAERDGPDDGTGRNTKLSAPNPDDEALVCAAAYFGYEFYDRKDNICLIYERDLKKTIEIEIFYTLGFTSKRKRMSVVCRDVDGLIKVVSKGADSIMLSRANPSDQELIQKTAQDIDTFSVEGLRCLVLGRKIIEESFFNEWRKKYDKALTKLEELDKRKKGLDNLIDDLEDEIEKNFSIIGATAIEDRLQDGVPECIEKLVNAGIKVWVLTGDKEETAINIAVACNLVQPPQYMDQVIINKNTAAEVDQAIAMLKSELERLESEISSSSGVKKTGPRVVSDASGVELKDMASGTLANVKPRALIIDGPSLIPLMEDQQAKERVLKFSQRCQAVVCCRVSPDQKRQIVDLVKEFVPGVRTLAVGDGANDVAMITGAHIGVGIRGEEGVQAVNASDFAIAQFRFLDPLLLKHGRYNYIRMSSVINYMFYKNVYMSLCMFWFTTVCAFSGQKYFTEGAIQFFNLFYTSIPIILYGAYDHDVAAYDVARFPQLYKACIRNDFFNAKIFWGWVGSGIIESVLCAILPLYFLTNFSFLTGNESSFLEAGAVCFTTIVIIVNLKMFTIQSKWNFFHLLIVALSIGSWIGIAYIINIWLTIDFDFYFLWNRLLKTGVFWLTLWLLCTIICIKDLVLAAVTRFYYYKPHHILQELDKYGVNPPAFNRLSSEEPSGKGVGIESEASEQTNDMKPLTPSEVEMNTAYAPEELVNARNSSGSKNGSV